MTKKQYGDYQFDIYFDGLEGQTPNYPVDYAVLERAAAEVLPPWVLSYVAGGAGDESTQRGNVEAFSRYGIMPRMFVGATERDLSVSLFDMRLPTPLFYALAVGGTDAVVSQLRAVLSELDLTMAIDGYRSIADLRAAGAIRRVT
jgi:isopentenyl diphosphate isomerase/L-lactate dehydrogenase-like FMN-dependent dehydrogenase